MEEAISHYNLQRLKEEMDWWYIEGESKNEHVGTLCKSRDTL